MNSRLGTTGNWPTERKKITNKINKQSRQKKFVDFCIFLFSIGIFKTYLLFGFAAQANPGAIAVLRSPDNAEEWQGILQRLESANIEYRTLEIDQLQQAADLSGTAILFLPNIENLSPQQVIALEEWISQGGRVIASGPLGVQSNNGVRQALRSLLGAYWSSELPETRSLQLALCPGTTACPDSWLPQVASTPVQGGVVVPNGLMSQTAATWEYTNNLGAVVTSDRATFLGWYWGSNPATAEFDRAWLQSAITRYENVQPPTIARRETSPMPPANSNQPQIQLSPNRENPPRVANQGLPLNPTLDLANLKDPAEQTAPAAVNIAPGVEPLTPIEAIRMREELEMLLGRVESALLLSSAVNGSIADQVCTENETTQCNQEATAEDRTLVAAIAPEIKAETISTGIARDAASAIAQARQVLAQLPQLIEQRNYTAARSQWRQARDLLWQYYPTDEPRAIAEIRAIWLDRGTIIRAGSEQGLAQIFDRLKTAGINTVFFETVNAGYPIYPSAIAPEQNPMARGWDPLAAAVKLAHERDMELHAWIWTFAAGNQRHNVLLNQPTDYPGPLIAVHPAWANYDERGQMIPLGQTKPFLDPANPEVRSYLLRLIEEIATRYDVDGLQLDYIRYPFQDPSAGRSYGYGLAARQQFQQLAGVDPKQITPSDRELWQRWTEFRTQQVDFFVSEASRLVRRLKPNLIFSVAVFPLPQHERLQKIQQNWELWAQRGDVDLVVTMTYAMDTNRLQQLASPWLNGSSNVGSALILPAIRLLNLPEIVAVDQIQSLRDSATGGFSLFAAENLSDRLQGIFQRTQGTPEQQNEPIPYRQPFAAAAVRLEMLQREWGYLLENNQLELRDRDRLQQSRRF